jgi:hypothetical protein
MNLQHRIDLLVRLGQYISGDSSDWAFVKEKAERENGWFIPAFINKAVQNIATHFLQKEKLEAWIKGYAAFSAERPVKKTGIIMAGNIPLVGFHDFLCVFISGHTAIIKPSYKDQSLIRHLAGKLTAWEPACAESIQFADMLKGCDAYIATGSNNSSRYFEYYFAKFPHIIRRNRTSVAVLTGNETKVELEKLADDVHLYFGLGCRNVTKLYVPEGYDFVPLLDAFSKYTYLADHHKYKNNYDYSLALHMLNKKYYMTNGAILLVEEPAIFSPISQLNYSFYKDENKINAGLTKNDDIQCVVGHQYIPFGEAQTPSLAEYADGVNTLDFLNSF